MKTDMRAKRIINKRDDMYVTDFYVVTMFKVLRDKKQQEHWNFGVSDKMKTEKCEAQYAPGASEWKKREERVKKFRIKTIKTLNFLDTH